MLSFATLASREFLDLAACVGITWQRMIHHAQLLRKLDPSQACIYTNYFTNSERSA
jgi:hypothetical protein